MQEGKIAIWKKSEIKLVIMLNWNYFPGQALSAWKMFMGNLLWLLIRVARTDWGGNH